MLMKVKKFKKVIKKSIKGLTEELLGMYYASPLTFHQSRLQLYGIMAHPKEISPKLFYNAVERIRKQGWLEKKLIEDKIFYRITQEGKIKFLRYQLKKAPKKRGEQATIIIFDIPEEKRTYRNFLRSLLKSMEFTMIQKSVFITPNILPKEFYDLLKEMDLFRFVKIIEGRIRV